MLIIPLRAESSGVKQCIRKLTSRKMAAIGESGDSYSSGTLGKDPPLSECPEPVAIVGMGV